MRCPLTFRIYLRSDRYSLRSLRHRSSVVLKDELSFCWPDVIDKIEAFGKSDDPKADPPAASCTLAASSSEKPLSNCAAGRVCHSSSTILSAATSLILFVLLSQSASSLI